jgi:hypothetical protein
VEAASPPVDAYSTNIASFSAHIAYVYNTYGEGGSNNMWFAPTDEVMQYILTREKAVVSYTGTGVCGAIIPASPTATRTPLNTRTNTPVVTPTLTRTPGNTPTVTATGVPTTAVLAFSKTVPVFAFPNPGAVNTPVSIDFNITRAATNVIFKLYTTSARCIRTVKKSSAEMMVYPNTGGLKYGRNVMKLDWLVFNGLAQGNYFYVVVVEDADTKNVKSKVETLIILR